MFNYAKLPARVRAIHRLCADAVAPHVGAIRVNQNLFEIFIDSSNDAWVGMAQWTFMLEPSLRVPPAVTMVDGLPRARNVFDAIVGDQGFHDSVVFRCVHEIVIFLHVNTFVWVPGRSQCERAHRPAIVAQIFMKFAGRGTPSTMFPRQLTRREGSNM